MTTPKENFINALKQSLKENSFIKLNLANYKGAEPELKKLLVKRAIIKKKEKLSIIYRYQTNDITKNYEFVKGVDLLEFYLEKNKFQHANLFTVEKDYQLQCSKKGAWKLFENKASITDLPAKSHDKNKDRKITANGKQYLYDLKITDAQGNVRPHGRDKYKQINHYIEILSSLLKDLPQKELTHIVDMGSGKGYLTFALYDYVNNVLKTPSKITGVEYRKDLVDLCNTIASQSNFKQLHFVEGSIENYTAESNLDVLIALHACDTATDDAIYKGIQSNAELIVVAPCCHKQIRKEMQREKVQNETEFLTKHGIFMERQAEMVTDGLRAQYLELSGYSTKIFEFISTEHTPKNVLIVAQKRKKAIDNEAQLLNEINSTKKNFGIRKHHLGVLLEDTRS